MQRVSTGPRLRYLRIMMLIIYSAAQLAMIVLRNGGTSLDAVEAAVKMLEDREITNAGYGSNLAMDGVVECDASVIDHYGRSGAVGAVARKSFTAGSCPNTNKSSQRSRILFAWHEWSTTTPWIH